MEMMASRIAKLIKRQDAQEKQVALIPRKSVRTVRTNALGVEREVTAKQIARRFLLILLLILFLVKRGPSVPLATASGKVDKKPLQAPALLLLCLFPSVPVAKASGEVDKETLQAPALLLLCLFPSVPLAKASGEVCSFLC